MLSALELHLQIPGLLLCTLGNAIPDSFTHKLCFLLLFLHSLSLQVKTVPTFPPLDHSRTSNQDTFYLTLHLYQRWQKKKNHTPFSKQHTKILHWAIYHFLMTITMMNRTIRLNKNWHFFPFDLFDLGSAGLHISRDCRCLSLEPPHSAMFRKARFQSLTNFSSGYSMGPDTISILMMSLEEIRSHPLEN